MVNLDIVTVVLKCRKSDRKPAKIRLSIQTTAKDAGKINYGKINLIK